MLIARRNALESHPEMIAQSNTEATPIFVRNVANHWHCDSSYEAETAVFTMLYGVEAPDVGGETLFADLVAAYEGLPAEKKAHYETLSVKHATSAATPLPDEYISDPASLPEEFRKSVTVPDPVTHSLVRAHPVSGRKALYGLGGSAYGIEGWPDEEGNAFVMELRRYATQERFRSACKLMPRDVLIWDNFSTMHRATPIDYSDAPGERRLNYRISLKGGPAFAEAAWPVPPS
jgi:alpha-ketoglutarate-dependent taurine dioxygenase